MFLPFKSNWNLTPGTWQLRFKPADYTAIRMRPQRCEPQQIYKETSLLKIYSLRERESFITKTLK